MNLISKIFPPNGRIDSVVRYRVHRKKGVIFALSPAHRQARSWWADLLPAQTRVARLYRSVIRLTEAARIPFPLEMVKIDIVQGGSLWNFMQEFIGPAASPLLLPGNPHGPAPRLTVIFPDGHDQPAVVFKIGPGTTAQELIRAEFSALERVSLSPHAVLAPRERGFFDEGEISAFAMEFIPGKNPPWPASASFLETFLSRLIDHTQTKRVSESPIIQRLIQSLGGKPPQSFAGFFNQPMRTCLTHGDFVPWNIRVQPDGSWVMLDWERGEFDGIPGWDWLHFVIQSAILIKKWSYGKVLNLARQTINSAEFMRHLELGYPGALAAEHRESLLRSYLLYNWRVAQQSKGWTIQAKLAAFAAGDDF